MGLAEIHGLLVGRNRRIAVDGTGISPAKEVAERDERRHVAGIRNLRTSARPSLDIKGTPLPRAIISPMRILPVSLPPSAALR